MKLNEAPRSSVTEWRFITPLSALPDGEGSNSRVRFGLTADKVAHSHNPASDDSLKTTQLETGARILAPCATAGTKQFANRDSAYNSAGEETAEFETAKRFPQARFAAGVSVSCQGRFGRSDSGRSRPRTRSYIYDSLTVPRASLYRLVAPMPSFNSSEKSWSALR